MTPEQNEDTRYLEIQTYTHSWTWMLIFRKIEILTQKSLLYRQERNHSYFCFWSVILIFFLSVIVRDIITRICYFLVSQFYFMKHFYWRFSMRFFAKRNLWACHGTLQCEEKVKYKVLVRVNHTFSKENIFSLISGESEDILNIISKYQRIGLNKIFPIRFQTQGVKSLAGFDYKIFEELLKILFQQQFCRV